MHDFRPRAALRPAIVFSIFHLRRSQLFRFAGFRLRLLDAIAEYASEDVSVCLFADFLDGSRDSDELSFYLYCSHLIASMPEEACHRD